ncbi:MAG: hypothetical protein LC808_28795 [Actinobacteria bacterium]|nr:hypothetical protein [Actinomycetota bacterium]
MRVVVENIAVDPECDEYKPPPRRGHRVVIALTVETSPTFDPVTIPPPTWYEWSTISPDGVSEGQLSTYYGCHDTEDLPSEFRPAAKYRGEVTLDTANAGGRVVLGDLFAWDY